MHALEMDKLTHLMERTIYTGYIGSPTIIKAVSSYDLWILHICFVVESNNDVNVLNQSPLFIGVLKREAPNVNFKMGGHDYKQGYYLADGIYPRSHCL